MELTCDVMSPLPVAQAVNTFARRPKTFHKIYGADVHQDCLHLFNNCDQEFALRGVGLSTAPSIVTKILASAGFGQAKDNAGHSLISMVQLGCCGGTFSLHLSKHKGAILVARLPA